MAVFGCSRREATAILTTKRSRGSDHGGYQSKKDSAGREADERSAASFESGRHHLYEDDRRPGLRAAQGSPRRGREVSGGQEHAGRKGREGHQSRRRVE